MAESALMVYLEPLNTVSVGGKWSICEMLHDPDEEDQCSPSPVLFVSLGRGPILPPPPSHPKAFYCSPCPEWGDTSLLPGGLSWTSLLCGLSVLVSYPQAGQGSLSPLSVNTING